MAKTLAIVAHDEKKKDVLEWAKRHQEKLRHYKIIGTGSTGTMLRDKVGLDVQSVKSGPLGGDAQIGAMVVEGKIDGVIFIVDPMSSQPHEPDINALLRLCNLTNVPLATNMASADLMIAAHPED